ncbi:hypothetical protein, partial [Salinisphaera hydrothermalis]|uniref:hypothetical protein n=1 Tax=Salinisphaera hydrothermalis TaxID=563188 RepID=UPI001E2E00EB
MLLENEKALLFSTVRIEVSSPQFPSTSIGTGFIVSVPVPNREERYARKWCTREFELGGVSGWN